MYMACKRGFIPGNLITIWTYLKDLIHFSLFFKSIHMQGLYKVKLIYIPREKLAFYKQELMNKQQSDPRLREHNK